MNRPKRFEGWIIAALTLITVFALYRLGFRPETFRELVEIGPAIARYSQPSWQDMPRLGALILETVAMAIWGTAIAFLIAVPLAPIAAQNLSPHPVIFRMTREFFNFFRAMPDALLALILIQGFGLGPTAGAIALGLHTSGFLGKVVAENMERVPVGIYAGLQACGGSKVQVIRFGAWPSVERELVGHGLYLLDRNIRIGTTLGIVGGGGIGSELLVSLRTFNEPRAATVLILIIALILSTDAISGYLRKKMQ